MGGSVRRLVLQAVGLVAYQKANTAVRYTRLRAVFVTVAAGGERYNLFTNWSIEGWERKDLRSALGVGGL